MDYTQAMFGVHAMHLPAQILLQDAGKTATGQYLVSAVMIASSTVPILSAVALESNSPHELIVGDIVIRPHGKWTGRNYIGYGLGGLITSEAMFPRCWDIQSLDNGFKMPSK